MSAPVVFDSAFGSGADDAFALGLVLGSPELELRGVTTVCEDAEVRARMVCRFLTAAGRQHTAVSAGSDPQPSRAFGDSYQYYYHPGVIFGRTSKPREESAADFLGAQLTGKPASVTVVATGPLTNVARCLREHPDAASGIQRLVWLGGTLDRGGDSPGDESPGDANLRADPDAAREILESGVPLLIVPSNIAESLTLDQNDIAGIFTSGGILTNQIRALHQLEGSVPPSLGAALAAALCFSERYADTAELRCEIDSSGRLRQVDGAPNARVVLSVDATDFARWFVTRMSALVPPAHRPQRVAATGSMPAQVHVVEDYETDIERRWWMSGIAESDDVPPGSTRACRGVLTQDFDDLLGNPKAMYTAVIFNPVPGPPMGPNTRLTFRYKLGGTDRLRVQIYSLSNGYHRHLVVEGLTQGRWDSATVDMTEARRADGTGGPLSENERIDDIQFYADPEASLLIDDIVLYDAANPQETQPFPKTIHFTGWFDTGQQGKEWPGSFDIVEHDAPRKWKAARSVVSPGDSRPSIRVHLRGERTLGATPHLRFDYRLTGGNSFQVQLVDPAGAIAATAVAVNASDGLWKTATMSFELPGPDLAAPLKVSEIRFLLPSEGSQLLVDNPLLFQPDAEPVAAPNRGAAPAFHGPPGRFPHRIWAACDFEGQTPDYGWFGPAVQDSILTYPGNRTALGVGDRPYGDFSALMTGVNPVPGPRMGKQNKLYVRYRLEGTSEAVFQHFSLTSEDNQHVRVSGLRQNEWAETVVDFTGDAVRNDGSLQVFQEGERMDDFKVFAGPPNDGKHYDLLIDDVVFFADDPSAPPETEPFPRRIILLAAFDTGPQERYWPGSFELVEDGLPEGSHWRAARAVPQQPGAPNKWIRVQITPLRPVGERTRLRFRYYLRGARNMTVQIFDATVQDNRHVRLENLTQGAWTTASVDFTRDGIRNDGTTGDAFAAGNLVDDLFFFVAPEGEEELDLLIDEVVLYDAGED